MPLTALISFKVKLEARNRIRIPLLFRWKYRMEPGELLSVTAELFESGISEDFPARMTGDGRLTVPKLTIDVLEAEAGASIAGTILRVSILPGVRQDAAALS